MLKSRYWNAQNPGFIYEHPVRDETVGVGCAKCARRVVAKRLQLSDALTKSGAQFSSSWQSKESYMVLFSEVDSV